MGQLSAVKKFLKGVGVFLAAAGLTVGRAVVVGYQAAWNFLKIRVPWVRALVRRHAQNPSTIFVDGAILILILYVIFGTIGYVLIYPKKSETRFAETLATLYPLPAAKVSGAYVWSHDFLERLRFLNTFNTRAPQDVQAKPPTDTELRTRVLEGLIEDRIIFLEAKERGLRVTEEELAQSLEKQGQPDEVAKKIKDLYSMNLTDFKKIIAEQVLKEKVKNSALTRIRVQHILVSTQQVASTAKQQLTGGKSFVDVAKEFSQDAKTKDSGGDLGYWRKEDKKRGTDQRIVGLA